MFIFKRRERFSNYILCLWVTGLCVNAFFGCTSNWKWSLGGFVKGFCGGRVYLTYCFSFKLSNFKFVRNYLLGSSLYFGWERWFGWVEWVLVAVCTKKKSGLVSCQPSLEKQSFIFGTKNRHDDWEVFLIIWKRTEKIESVAEFARFSVACRSVNLS